MKAFRLLWSALLVATLFTFPISFLYGNDQQRDAEFARGLLRWGYADLAEKCAKNIIKKDFLGEKSVSRSKLERGDGEYVLIELEKYRADKAGDEKTRKKHLANYEKMLKRFQKRYQGHPQALAVAMNLVLSKRQEAIRSLEKARVEPDEGQRKKKIKEGISRFKKVVDSFEKLIFKYKKSMMAQIKPMMVKLKKEAKDEFERDDITEDSTLEYLATTDRSFGELVFRRVYSEYLKGESCLLFVRWQEALEVREQTSKYLELAQKSFTIIEYDFSVFQGLVGKAGLGLGEVLMRQGKLKEATNKYDGFTLFKFQPLSKDPTRKAQEEEMTKEIAMEAYYGLASVWIRRKRFDNAIKIVDLMLKNYSDALSVHGGRMALLAKCEALSTMPNPEPHKAMEEASKIVEWSKKNEKKLPGRAFGLAALQAAVRMAEIRKKMEGQVEFSPDVSLVIATGFYETGKYKWAIYAYKDVLSSKNVEEDLIVEALKGMGNCYNNTKRFEEAAMAYAGVLERFPDRREAIKMAGQALGILSGRFGKEDEAVREFKKGLEDRLGGAATYYNRGLETRIQAQDFKSQKKTSLAVKRYKEAITAFKKVKAVDPSSGNPVRYFGDAQAAIGDCLYQRYLLENKKELLDESLAFLRKKLKEFKNNNRRGWAASAFYLGQIYVDQENYKKALQVLKPFDDQLKSILKYATPAKSLVIRSAVATGEAKIAEDQFKRLVKTEGASSSRAAQAAYLLTSTYYGFILKEREKIQNSFKTYSFFFNRSNLAGLVSSKSISYALLQKNKFGIPRLQSARVQCSKFALFLFKYYKAKNQLDFGTVYWLGDIVLGAKRYSRAIQIYSQAVKMTPKLPKNATKAQVLGNKRYKFFVKRFLAQAYLGAGKNKNSKSLLSTALKLYEELAKNKDFQRSLFMYRILEGRAYSAYYLAKASRFSKKGETVTAVEHFSDFRGKVIKMSSRRAQYAALRKMGESEIGLRFFEVSYIYFELLFRVGNFKECFQRIESLKRQKPSLGSPKLKEKYESLLKSCKKRL